MCNVTLSYDVIFFKVMGQRVDCGLQDWQSHIDRVYYKHGSKFNTMFQSPWHDMPQYSTLSYLFYHRWVLGISPSGSSDLLSSLRTIFESGQILEDYGMISYLP